MTTKSLLDGDIYIVRGSPSLGLTARGRMMRVAGDQEIEFLPPNRYFWPTFEHIGGPMVGIRIRFSLVLARRARIHNTCTCSRYTYPHKTGAGKCQTKT